MIKRRRPKGFHPCECGCTGLTKNRFIWGHNLRGKTSWIKGLTKETDSRVETMAGKLRGRTKETHSGPAIVSEKLKGRTKENDPWKAALSETLRGRTKETDPVVAAHAEKMKGRTKETHPGIAIRAEKMRGRTKETHSYLAVLSEKYTGRTKETYPHIAAQAEKVRQIMFDKFKYDKEYIKNYSMGCNAKPNKLELEFNEFLQELLPGEYKYVGDFELMIGGKNPDFTNINGQKKLIELFGDYWHSEKLLGVPKEKSEQDRIDHFKQY